MSWKNFVIPLAVRPRRKVVTTALVYGLSLAVRFTSAAGEETEVAPPAPRGAYPITSITINDGGRAFYRDWPRPDQPIAFRSRARGSQACGAACDGPITSPLMSACPAP
jgi:hypothetical protein